MDKSILDFLNLIRETLNKEEGKDQYDYSNTNWNEVISLAGSTKMLGIIFKRLKEISREYPELNPYISTIESQVMVRGIQEIRKKDLLNTILGIARDENIPVLVFKGVVISSLYPEPCMRFSSDTDMYIDREYRDRMADIFVKLGYQFDNEASNENVVKYFLPGQHYIELHSKLWSYVKGTKIDTLDGMKLTDKRIHAVYDGVGCDTIDYAEQLVFLIYHMCKHLMLDCANIRFATDIMLFFRAHYNEMDLKLFRERMILLEYWDFFSLLYEISVRFLGFTRLQVMEELGCTPYDDSAAEAVICELMLINRDDYDAEHRYLFTYNILPYLTGDTDDTGCMSRNSKAFRYLFPKAKDFPEEFSYVRKFPVLLPIGWIHRIIDYAIDRLFRKDKRISGKERLDRVDAKMDRMRRMKLIK